MNYVQRTAIYRGNRAMAENAAKVYAQAEIISFILQAYCQYEEFVHKGVLEQLRDRLIDELNEAK